MVEAVNFKYHAAHRSTPAELAELVQVPLK